MTQEQDSAQTEAIATETHQTTTTTQTNTKSSLRSENPTHPLVLKSTDKALDIWFDSLTIPLTLECTDKNTVIIETYNAINQKRPLHKEKLPSIVIEDKAPRILFLSICNGFSKALVARGSGSGLLAALDSVLTQLSALCTEDYRPIWIKLDMVTESTTHLDADLSKTVNFDRSLYGLAFTKAIDLSFLPEQLTTYTLITCTDNIHLGNIEKYIASNPHQHNHDQKLKNFNQSTLYQFKTDSLFFDGNTSIPLYRGHRLFDSISKNNLLDSIDNAVDYLLRSINLDGTFNYSYKPKTDRSDDEYNLLDHSGTLYSLLEAYTLTPADKILSGAQRATQYLLGQLKETTINSQKALVAVEEGNVTLGQNALAILALGKYILITGDQTYLPIVQQLGTWIISTQKSQGEFSIHKQAYNGEMDKTFISEYCPGKAVFALSLLYAIDPQQKWLSSAISGAQYLINIRNKGLIDPSLTHDYCLLYALKEINQQQPNEIFIAHAIKTA